MASLWTRASILLKDNAGNIAKVIVLVASAAIDPSGGAVDAIARALQALTKAASPRRETGTEKGEATAEAVAGHYGVVEDRMVLTFRAEDGSTEVFEIPGPVDECFVANSDRVDPDAAPSLGVISFITDNAVSLFGESLVFVKGFRSRKHQMKR